MEDNRIQNQIAIYMTNKKLCEFTDKLKPAPIEYYAHMHAQGEEQAPHQVEHRVGLELEDTARLGRCERDRLPALGRDAAGPFAWVGREQSLAHGVGEREVEDGEGVVGGGGAAGLADPAVGRGLVGGDPVEHAADVGGLDVLEAHGSEGGFDAGVAGADVVGVGLGFELGLLDGFEPAVEPVGEDGAGVGWHPSGAFEFGDLGGHLGLEPGFDDGRDACGVDAGSEGLGVGAGDADLSAFACGRVAWSFAYVGPEFAVGVPEV